MANDEFQKRLNDRDVEILELEKGQKKLKTLKDLRKRLNWEIIGERERFYWQLCRLINDWKSQLPNLREFFCKEEIDWLLTKCMKIGPAALMKFVIRTGYRDEPDLDEDGKPLLLRETAIHYAARRGVRHWTSKIRELFKVYDKFDANYTDAFNYTHFHAACMSGCVDIVKEFLELGQDPNCIVEKTGVSALLLALHNKRWDVAQLLLRSHADPNRTAKDGTAPLHIICQMKRGDIPTGVIKSLFECSDERYHRVLVDVRDSTYGVTPLHLALRARHTEVVELLLSRGADPNLANNDGSTALHYICDEATHEAGDLDESLFDLLEKYRPLRDIQARTREWGRTPLHGAALNGKRRMMEKLLRKGADPNSVNKAGWTVLHYLIRRENDDCDDDLMEKFFEIADDLGRTVRLEAKCDEGATPLEAALIYGRQRYVQVLLRRGADPNFVNAVQERKTALHIMARRITQDDLPDRFFETCREIGKSVDIEALDSDGMTPLNLALHLGKEIMVESLLRNGADPNKHSLFFGRPLHVICRRDIDDDSVERFLRICDDVQQKVQIDARGKSRQDTALHSALFMGNKQNARDLLRRGADPNAVDDQGWTPLHISALRKIDDDSPKMFLEICKDRQLEVRVNAGCNLERTPLYMALQNGHRKLTESLLRNGANANLADRNGSTPLHVICSRDVDDDLVKLFFEIANDVRQTVQIDVQDAWDWTPLQTAVANLLPNVVDVLLGRGADLSSFIFPTENYFCERFDEYKSDYWDKLKLASGILAVVECLNKRGYELERSDFLTIIELFYHYEMFEESSDDLENSLRDDEEFTSIAKEIIIIPNLSLYDLIQLRSEKAAKLLAYKNYFEIERANNLDKIPEQYRDMCLRHLCEKVSRRYFQRMALEPFQALIHYRLPILCCDKVIENLTNKDLSNIFEADEIET
ncbi:ankyrin-1-like [Trichogramma pretiosum]|uniref:ankyrin-1-like n=1 Tax=Trichogramma pretiosum TaxID=7493 RepID=UPI0006C957D5|nr:ankyrin-1-like [Trichogramma pretiosum]